MSAPSSDPAQEAPSTSSPTAESLPLASLALTDSSQTPADPTTPPTHAERDIQINPETGKPDGPKAGRPFDFGQRFLNPTDDPFAHNAWDHVEPDEEFQSFMETQLSLQRESPVPEHLRKKYTENPARYWDVFYHHNADNFFKDRKWLFLEFPVLQALTRADAGPKLILEVGCGAGNTLIPLARQCENPEAKMVGVDFSPRSAEMVEAKCAELRASDEFKGHPEAHCWDLASTDPIPGIEDGSVDCLVLIFILSALDPKQWAQALQNIARLLKPGGMVLLRDYARGDLAQVRFRKGRYLDENFYVRGDGTRVYFFDEQEVRNLFEGAGLKVESSGLDRRMLVNRQKKLKMYRCWLQVVSSKPLPEEVPEKPAAGADAEDEEDYDSEEDEDYEPSESEPGSSEYSTEDEELDWEAERELDVVVEEEEKEAEEEEERHEEPELKDISGVRTPRPE